MVEDFEDPTYLSNVIFLKNSKGFQVPENLSFRGVSISRSMKLPMERFGVLIPEKRTSLSGPLSCVQ